MSNDFTQRESAVVVLPNRTHIPVKQIVPDSTIAFAIKPCQYLLTTRANKDDRRISKRRVIRLLYIMLIIFVVFCFVPAKAQIWPAALPWTDNDSSWYVRYNEGDGAIHIFLKTIRDTTYNGGSSYSFQNYIDSAQVYANLEISRDNGITWSSFFVAYYSSSLQLITTPQNGFDATVNSVYADSSIIYFSSLGRNVTNVNWWADIKLIPDGITSGNTLIKLSGSWIVELTNITNPAHHPGVGSNLSGIRTIAPLNFSTINIPSYEFVTVDSSGFHRGKARITYTKDNLNDVDLQSRMQLVNALTHIAEPGYDKITNVIQNGNYPTARSGSNDVYLGTSDSSYYFIQNEGGVTGLGDTSAGITVPAFALPKLAKSSYDSIAHTVQLTWNLDQITTKNYVKDGIKVQIANNANFDGAQEISRTYNPDSSSYTYVADKNLSPHMYFRIARDHSGPDWNTWDLATTTDVIIPFYGIDTGKTSLY